MQKCVDNGNISKQNFSYNLLLSDINFETLKILVKKLNQEKFALPLEFIKKLQNNNYLDEFVKYANFSYFKNQFPNFDQFANSMTEMELNNFLTFATVLGCLSDEKILDKNIKETETFIGQKASSTLGLFIRNKKLSANDFGEFFTSLPINSKPNQDFLKFIRQQEKTSFPNLTTLLDLEEKYPRAFIKVMTNFDSVKCFKTTLNEHGSPVSIPWKEALNKFCVATKYSGITNENKFIADLFSQHDLSQHVFDKTNNLIATAKSNNIKPHILEKHIKEPTIFKNITKMNLQTESILVGSKELIDELYAKLFTYEMLDKYDPKNAIIGLYCSCCATIDSSYHGKYIAEKSITAPDVQNLIIRDNKNNIIAKGSLYVNIEKSYAVFNEFEINEKYTQDRIDNCPGYYQDMPEKKHERDMIFQAFMRGVNAFVKEYDIEHPYNPIKFVAVGMGHNKLKTQCEQFKIDTNNLEVPQDYRFDDAYNERRILYDRNCIIKENEKGDFSL